MEQEHIFQVLGVKEVADVDVAYQMIDVSEKNISFRRATAQGTIWVGAEAFAQIEAKKIPKGCPKILAEIAGINGAKQASQTIPLCHPLPLDSIQVSVVSNREQASYTVNCTVSTNAKTGVEMEALAGVNSALLTIYDLTKMIEPALEIGEIYLVTKEGGKHGVWNHPKNNKIELLEKRVSSIDLSDFSVGEITLSDRAARGAYIDQSTPKIQQLLLETKINLCDSKLIADDAQQLILAIEELVNQGADWIITTGGTGLGPRDITYPTLKELCDQDIPGLAEKLRQESARYTPYAWVSRVYAGIYQRTLITAIPGNPKAIIQLLPVLTSLMKHTLSVLKTGT